MKSQQRKSELHEAGELKGRGKFLKLISHQYAKREGRMLLLVNVIKL